MELRVGSNIMIHFLLYIAVSHMAHVLVYYTLLVVIIIKMLENVKRNEFGYTRE